MLQGYRTLLHCNKSIVRRRLTSRQAAGPGWRRRTRGRDTPTGLRHPLSPSPPPSPPPSLSSSLTLTQSGEGWRGRGRDSVWAWQDGRRLSLLCRNELIVGVATERLAPPPFFCRHCKFVSRDVHATSQLHG